MAGGGGRREEAAALGDLKGWEEASSEGIQLGINLEIRARAEFAHLSPEG